MRALILGSRARLIFLICALAGGYFIYTAINDAIENHRIADERNAASQEVAELQQKKLELEGVKQYAGSDAYVEQVARRQLGYVRDGEVPVVVTSPPLTATEQPAGEWWERLFPH